MVNFIKILVVSILFISNLSYSGWFGNSKCDEIESLLYLVTKEKDNGLKSKDLLKELELYFKNKEANGADFVKNEFRRMTVTGVFASMPYHQGYSLSNSKAKSATKWAINRQVEGCKEGIFDKQFNLVGVDSLDIDDLVLNAYSNGQAKQEIEYDENKLVLTRWYKSGQKSLRDDYKNKKLHGVHKAWHINGQILEIANYINGKLDGKHELWNVGGDRVEVSNYKNDKLHGKRELWHENGEKSFTTRLIDGEMDGEYISWYDNGEKAQKYFIKNGMLNGLHTLWYDNGQKAYIVNYLNGEIDHENKMVIYAWKKNGDRLTEIEFNPKTLDGFFYAWHKNGQKMIDDEGDGESYFLYENGQKHQEQEYDPERSLEYDNDGEYLMWHENGEELFSGSIIKDKIHGDFVFYYDNGKVKYKGVAINGKIKGRLKSFYSNGKVMNTDWDAAYSDIWKDVVTSPSEKLEILLDETFTNYFKLNDKVSKMEGETVKYIENFKLQLGDDFKNYSKMTVGMLILLVLIRAITLIIKKITSSQKASFYLINIKMVK
mgnify:CR=1 FL=1